MAKEKTKQKPRYLTKALRCPDGSRKYIRGKTQAELDRKVREAQAQLGMGININDNTTVAEFTQVWVDVYKRPKLRPQSLVQLISLLNTHIVPYIGAKKVRDVKPADCAAVLSAASNKANSTQKRIRSCMRSIFSCACENGVIVRNPVTSWVMAGGAPPRKRSALTSKQMEELCRMSLTNRNPRLLTFVLLCGFAGLRESEALGLNLRNVDLEAGVLHVEEQFVSTAGQCYVTPVLKTDASRRTVPLPPILLAHLTALKQDLKDGYLFDVTNRNLRGCYIAAVSRMCGVDNAGAQKQYVRNRDRLDFYVHPHLLRHTYATRCFEAGLDVKAVQYLLGHSRPEMTMNIYVHYLAEARQEDTAKKIARAFPGTALAVVGG